jgi:trimethylamine--corrinoid protein Co-methyltransferase
MVAMNENLAIEAESTGGRRGRGDRGGGAAARRAARSGGGPGQQLTYIRRKVKVY